MFPQRKRGFTLIELLVVVTIIALLVAILVPFLGRATKLARMAVCGTKIRGICQANMSYATQNDFTLCNADDHLSVRDQSGWYSSYPHVDNPGGSILVKQGYVSNDLRAFLCPSDTQERADGNGAFQRTQYIRPPNFSYTRNAWADHRVGATGQGWANRTPNIQRIKYPAKTALLLAELETSPFNDGIFLGNAYDRVTQRHLGYRGTIAFFDGAARAIDSKEYNQATMSWRDANYLDPQ